MLLVTLGNGKQTPFDLDAELPQDAQIVTAVNGATYLTSGVDAELWTSL